MLHGKTARVRPFMGMLLVGVCLGVVIGQISLWPGEAARAAPLKQVVGKETPAATPHPPDHLVISEFRTRGPNGTSDEFIELFNPTVKAVNIGGWKIKKSSSCSTSVSTLVTITTGVVLQPGGHYLVAATEAILAIPADQTFSSSIANDGGIAVMDDKEFIVDQVGMCLSTQYREGTNLQPLSGNSDQSYARNPAASGCYDVDNNAADFSPISPSDPQNLSSTLAMCPGVALTPTRIMPTHTSARKPTPMPTLTPTPTPTRTPTPTPTRTPTRTPSPTITPVPGTVVINEFLPHPRTDWNGDGIVNVGDEYIEIINLGAAAVSLKGWKLDDDAGDSSPYALPDITLESRAITRFFHADTGIALSDGGDTVRLLKPAGQIVDAYTYPAVEAADISWCRLPDGNGVWTFACRPTPGRPNARAESGYLTPTPSGATGGQFPSEICPLADTVPEGIVQAECGDWRAAIWNWDLWGEGEEFWLESRFKWGVFIQ